MVFYNVIILFVVYCFVYCCCICFYIGCNMLKVNEFILIDVRELLI